MEDMELRLEIAPVAPGFYIVRAFDGEHEITDEYETTDLDKMTVAEFLNFYKDKLKEVK